MDKNKKVSVIVNLLLVITVLTIAVVILIATKAVTEIVGVGLFTALMIMFVSDMIWMLVTLKK